MSTEPENEQLSLTSVLPSPAYVEYAALSSGSCAEPSGTAMPAYCSVFSTMFSFFTASEKLKSP